MSERDLTPTEIERYSRQIRFGPIGMAGQQRLAASRVLVVGVGALGSTSAELLVRAGVGLVRLVDRDFLQTSNLQRQCLYDETDVASGLPKAAAAAKRLQQINSQVTVEAHVKDVNCWTLPRLAADIDLMIDGTDNFETRFLMNDWSQQQRLPWIFGGCVAAQGQVLGIVPGQTICLRCLMPAGPPPADALETCDTTGVLGPIVQVVAAVQALEALKWLSGNLEAMNRQLQVFSLWDNRWQQMTVDRATMSQNCLACRGQEYPWLGGQRGSQAQVLCGRNSVQIRPTDERSLDLNRIAESWQVLGTVVSNEYLVKLVRSDFEITLFPDGRAIISGTADLNRARSLYSQYVGN